MKKFLFVFMVAIAASTSIHAHDYQVGDLLIDHPVARATPANAPVSAGYMTIKNNGSQADILLGGSVPFAARVEIHEMAMDGDVMKMRQLTDGLEIPAGGEVKLMPGGFHMMFMQLDKSLEEGASYKGTLVFKNAGTVEIDFDVEDLQKIRANMAEGEMKMDHFGHGEMKPQ